MQRLDGLISLSALTLLAVLAVSCGSSKTSSPAVAPLQWMGIRVGMGQAEAEQALRKMGIQVGCERALNVTYLSKDTLHTRWIKAPHAGRLRRCEARRKKGAAPWDAGTTQIRLYFLDKKLYRLQAQVVSTDAAFERLLKTRFGPPRQILVQRIAYASKRPSKIRAWSLSRLGSRLLWLRSAHRQQLVLFALGARRVKLLEEISTPRKDG